MERYRLPLNALRAFEAVARHGSFTAAAAMLNIAQSALSRHVIGLEQQIGCRLFERGHKSISLTEEGRQLAATVSRSLDRIEQTLAVVGSTGSGRQRRLRINLPPSFALKLAVPLLTDFRAAFPDVALDVATPYTPPEGDFDIAVVYAKPTVDDWVTDLLWEERPTILCHPSLAETDATDLADFVAANEIIHVKVVESEPWQIWQSFMRQNGAHEASVTRGLTFDSASLAVQYALSGQGLALVDPMLFADEITAGRLARPFAATHYDGYGYYLKIESDGLSDPLISAFRSWMIERFAHPAEMSRRPARLRVIGA